MAGLSLDVSRDVMADAGTEIHSYGSNYNISVRLS